MDNFDRKFRFIGVDLLFAKLFVFINSSFAINADYNSQIKYVAILRNEKHSNKKFDLIRNVLY